MFTYLVVLIRVSIIVIPMNEFLSSIFQDNSTLSWVISRQIVKGNFSYTQILFMTLVKVLYDNYLLIIEAIGFSNIPIIHSI